MSKWLLELSRFGWETILVGREALRGREASWGTLSGEGLKPGETGEEETESLLEPSEKREDIRLADLTGADSIFFCVFLCIYIIFFRDRTKEESWQRDRGRERRGGWRWCGWDGGLRNRRSKRQIEEDHPEKRKKRPRRGREGKGG